MRAAAVVCLVMALAGCSGNAADPASAPPVLAPDGTLALVETPTGMALSRPLERNDTLARPVPWQVGDWFGVHVFVTGDDAEGTHYNAIVVEEDANSWLLATDDESGAKDEAVWDLPILGPMRKADLATTGLGGDWNILQFPLKDGATWTSDVSLAPDSDPARLEFEATFNPKIATAKGDQPGFDIRAVDSHANVTLEFDYVPTLRWFTKFLIHDTTTAAPDDYFARALSMGTGHNWKGIYYIDSATNVAEHIRLVGLNPESFPMMAVNEGDPTSTFQVSEDATYLYGFVFSFATFGTHETQLIPPDNQVRRYTATDPSFQGATIQEFIDEDAIPGEWRINTAGAGGFVGGGAFIWEVTETTATL